MQIGIDAEKDTLQSLIRSCLLELNSLKLELTKLEVERANDKTPQRLKELEQDIVDKEDWRSSLGELEDTNSDDEY